MAPRPGSPVIDAVPARHCPLRTDQRGQPRPDEAADQGACDIGAVESRARPSAPPLAIGRLQHRIVGGHMLLVPLQTAAYARVTITLEVVRHKVTVTGTGPHRRRVVQRVVLYHTQVRGTADRQGRYTGRLRITYRSPKPVPATLRVTAQTTHGTATRTIRVMVVPQVAQATPHRRVVARSLSPRGVAVGGRHRGRPSYSGAH
jgi:hypothetical protein